MYDTKKIIEHIKEFYPNIEDLKADFKAGIYGIFSPYNSAKRLVEGGCFLVLYSDVKSFMRSIGMDGRYSYEHSWSLYCHLLSKVIIAMCNDRDVNPIDKLIDKLT